MRVGAVLETRVETEVTSIWGTPTSSRDIRSLLMLNMLQVIESIASGHPLNLKGYGIRFLDIAILIHMRALMQNVAV